MKQISLLAVLLLGASAMAATSADIRPLIPLDKEQIVAPIANTQQSGPYFRPAKEAPATKWLQNLRYRYQRENLGDNWALSRTDTWERDNEGKVISYSENSYGHKLIKTYSEEKDIEAAYNPDGEGGLIPEYRIEKEYEMYKNQRTQKRYAYYIYNEAKGELVLRTKREYDLRLHNAILDENYDVNGVITYGRYYHLETDNKGRVVKSEEYDYRTGTLQYELSTTIYYTYNSDGECSEMTFYSGEQTTPYSIYKNIVWKFTDGYFITPGIGRFNEVISYDHCNSNGEVEYSARFTNEDNGSYSYIYTTPENKCVYKYIYTALPNGYTSENMQDAGYYGYGFNQYILYEWDDMGFITTYIWDTSYPDGARDSNRTESRINYTFDSTYGYLLTSESETVRSSISVTASGEESNSSIKYYSKYNYSDYKEYNVSGVEEIPAEGVETADVKYFNLQGLQVINPEKGELLIRVDSKGSRKIIY